MEKEIIQKVCCLINDTRVMTLAVSNKGVPWSSPVYFVCRDHQFYFFSNEMSLHVQAAAAGRPVSASIFNDSDRLDHIFGLQMAGHLERVSQKRVYLLIVKKYLAKFSFIEQAFGSQVLENKQFFMERFNSHLYCFCPDQVFLSDNSRSADKRRKIDLNTMG